MPRISTGIRYCMLKEKSDGLEQVKKQINIIAF